MTDRPELAAPWEARVFALADALRQAGDLEWTEFQAQVVDRLEPGATATYADWLAVLEVWCGLRDR